MTIEIERKFLVDHPLFMHPEYQKHVLKRVIIEQAYLCTMPVVRVKTVTDDGGELAYITIKGPGLLERAEYEYEIPVKDARAMMSMKTASTAMHVIKKMRRYVKPSNKEQDVIASVKKSWKKRDASFKKVKAEKKGIVTVAIEDVVGHFYDLLDIGTVIEENVRLKQERDALKAKFDTIVAAFEKVR